MFHLEQADVSSKGAMFGDGNGQGSVGCRKGPATVQHSYRLHSCCAFLQRALPCPLLHMPKAMPQDLGENGSDVS